MTDRRRLLSRSPAPSLGAPAFAALSLGVLWLLAVSTPLSAGPFEAEIELRLLDVDDRLVINRGGPVHDGGDINGDGLADLIIGSGGDTVRVVFGPQGGDDEGRIALSGLNGASGFAIPVEGLSLGGGGDLNGDGLDDIAVGTATATYVVYGRRERFAPAVTPDTLDGTNGFVFEAAGNSVAIIDDMNGDGLADLLVGSRGADSAGLRDAGRVAIVHGRRGTGPASLGVYNLDGSNGSVAYGEGTLALLGWSVESAGDMNGDGFGDLVMGAPGTLVDGLDEAGRAYVVHGSGTRVAVRDLAGIGNAALGAGGFVLEGAQIEATVGYSGRGIGDINGDGADDLAVGAPGKGPFGRPGPYPGEAHVVFGGAGIPVRFDTAALDGALGFTARGIRGGVENPAEGVIGWGDQAGSSVAGAGDLNADGTADLVIGAPYSIISNARRGNGELYVIWGRANGGFPARVDLGALDGENGFRLLGAGTTDYTGFSVSPAGDFDDDGIDDLVFGASGQGESYVLRGVSGAVRP